MSEDNLDLPVTLPTLPTLNARIEDAIKALPSDAQGAVFLLGELQDSGDVVGKIAVVHKIADGWTVDVEAHVTGVKGSGWDGRRWDHGESVLLRGQW